MPYDPLVSLASIVVLGAAAQWLAWRLRIPSILLLLAAGLIAGPVTGFLNPEKLLGELLLPIVSLSVAVILFEGGLSLRAHELRDVGQVLLRLATLGAIVSWGVTAVAAHALLHLGWPLSLMLGAILVVTGPTVIGPLLRHLRLGGQAGSLLKWEGILIDPVGAILAVLVFSAVRATGVKAVAGHLAWEFLLTAVAGTALGLLGALALVTPLRRYWAPDALHNSLVLAMLFAVFTVSNHIAEGAGLLAVTVMGIALANQKHVSIRHLVEFKENLTVLLISGLFILLAARLTRDDLRSLDWGVVGFVLALVLVARPAAVWISTVGSRVPWRERVFLAAMAPRGIVAAAVTSVFAIELADAGYASAERLPSIVFAVIIGTVLIYGLGAVPLARALQLAQPNPQGVLMVGANPWARAVAAALQQEGYPVLLVDSDWNSLSLARQAGLSTYFGSILSEHTLEEIDVGDLGRLMAFTANDEVNSLACLRFQHVFGRRDVYQLPVTRNIRQHPGEGEQRPGGRREAVSRDQRGRLLFRPELTYPRLVEQFGENPQLNATRLTVEFDYPAS